MQARFALALLGGLVPNIFSPFGLTGDQLSALENGRAVAKVLPWGGPSEMYILGAVHISGSPQAYLQSMRDVDRFAANPSVEDLQALTLDPDDIKALKGCHAGACDVQLPGGSMQRFRDAQDADGLARAMVIELVGAYRRGGNDALGMYNDKTRPALVARQFEAMIEHTSRLPDVLPELRDYLLHYPHADLAGVDSFFYWEKVSFGLKPTIRVNHAVIYRTVRDNRAIDVVAIKQLYASHYFHTALDVSVCVSDESGSAGFYLLTLKASEQEGLTGVKGSVLRKIVADKSRSALESVLTAIKRTLERSSS